MRGSLRRAQNINVCIMGITRIDVRQRASRRPPFNACAAKHCQTQGESQRSMTSILPAFRFRRLAGRASLAPAWPESADVFCELLEIGASGGLALSSPDPAACKGCSELGLSLDFSHRCRPLISLLSPWSNNTPAQTAGRSFRKAFIGTVATSERTAAIVTVYMYHEITESRVASGSRTRLSLIQAFVLPGSFRKLDHRLKLGQAHDADEAVA